MNQMYVVMTYGSWGRGKTLDAAKAQWKKAGGSIGYGGEWKAWVIESEGDLSSVTVNGMGDIVYPKGATIKKYDRKTKTAVPV